MDVGHREQAVSTALDGIQSVLVLVSPVRRGTSTHVLRAATTAVARA